MTRRETLEQRPVQSHARNRDTLALERFQHSMLELGGREGKRVQTEENWEALLAAGLLHRAIASGAIPLQKSLL